MQKLSDIVGHPLRIFLLTQDAELAASFQGLWPTDQLTWTVFSDGQSALEQVFVEPPDLVIAERFLPGIGGVELLRNLKEENVYRQICAILVLRDQDVPGLTSTDLATDALIIVPTSDDRLRLRTELGLKRITTTLDVNPLTRLPGNSSIINTTQRLLSNGADFALAYVDMDNFKPYNDKYGFSRGDEMLLMTARLIVNTVSAQQCQPSFVGHVGGDDFVFILPIGVIEHACERLVSDFDAIAPSFYDPADRKRKSILSCDRQGHELAFPIISISISIVQNIEARYTHYAQLSHVAGQLKRIAKATVGSNYVIDRRHQ
ncbi:MAG: diguanylate cyclase [Deltaproteobacteria bacterium]|jgi:diguanylate cyclase (GGDEF)-like protein|nr:diguanylate cyclase [Deltaproteobacteria bacterium]